MPANGRLLVSQTSAIRIMVEDIKLSTAAHRADNITVRHFTRNTSVQVFAFIYILVVYCHFDFILLLQLHFYLNKCSDKTRKILVDKIS